MIDVQDNVRKIPLTEFFDHLCTSTGLYSKETFLSLYRCIVRMLREHTFSGFIITRTLNDETFNAMAHALDELPNLPLFNLDNTAFSSENGWDEQTGFLLVLTDRLCAAVFWSGTTHATFRMYDGGWTFHPRDCQIIAERLIRHIQHPLLSDLLQGTAVDRRYDDKLSLLITALVNGLENRNRELTMAMDQLKVLNKRNVDTERLAAIGQLSSVIAHEIRNPLGLIDLYAKLTEEQINQIPPDILLDKKAVLEKNLSLIRQATGHLETILSELTDYSRPLQIQKSETDIPQLLREICDFYQPSYHTQGVVLVLSENPEPIHIAVDADKLRQALLNLLKNALEASPSDTTVTVHYSVQENMGNLGLESAPHLLIQITDEGKGIPPSQIKKLFTPYFSTKSSGTGLGLAHSQKILQAHGGYVELRSSTPGQGSVFALVLPIYDGS